MSIEDAKQLEARASAASEAVAKLWRPDAEIILNLIDTGITLVIVAGPGGSGKSEHLAPNIVNVGQEKNFHPVYFDCQMLPNPASGAIADTFERRQKNYHPKKGLVILDEPPYEASEEVIEKDLSYLHKQKSAVVVALVRTQQQERTLVDKWVTAERSLGGKVNVYDLQPKQLPKDLARELLTALYRTPQTVVAYITDNFPLYPRVLDHLRGANDENGVIKLWQDMTSKIHAGWGFTEEEAGIVTSNLRV